VLSAADIAELTEVLAFAFPPYDVDPREVAEAEGLLFADDETGTPAADGAEPPVEDWMVWLHPEQASTVRRSFAGPARVRGRPGPGRPASRCTVSPGSPAPAWPVPRHVVRQDAAAVAAAELRPAVAVDCRPRRLRAPPRGGHAAPA
jgi:hypothetical protein